MTSMECNENVDGDNVLFSANESTQVVFTLRDGSFHVTSKNNQATDSVSNYFQNLPFENLKAKLEGEVYIEIIRNNADLLEEYPIINISSAYEAFWKSEFQACIERRTCMKCAQVFLTPQQLLHHLQNLHKISNPPECFVCRKYFMNGSERTTHLFKSHHLCKPNCTCEACFKVFNNEFEKNAHRVLHLKKKKCKWCSEPFPCEYLLNCHIQHCSLQRNDLDCHICGCHFKSSHILQLHSLRHSRVACDICQLNLLSAAGASLDDPEVLLIRHLKNNHSSEDINNILMKLKKRDEEEQTLDNLFMIQIQENLSQLSDSVKQNHQQKNQTDNSVDILYGKQQQDHREIYVESSFQETSLQCSECLKKFKSMEELLKHELDHQTPFSCSVCYLKFPHRRGFKMHMRTHGIQVKPDSVRYKCQQCSVKCGTLSALRTHLLTHTNLKPHLCDKCGLKFRRLHALKAHEYTVHNSRILHHCSQCDTSSFSKSSLLRHVQCVHGGVRRFICGICGNRCLQNQGLRRHLKNVHKLDFPPMESLYKKSSTEIHVIPPAENLSPTDPLVESLKLAIREEKLKLDLLRKQQRTKENVTDGSHQPTESNVDGQSLNILGDVASKATPLQQINCPTPFLQPLIGPKLQEAMRFLSSDNLNDLSIHLTQCQQEKCVSFIDEDNSALPEVPGISVKPPPGHSLTSSFSSSASALTPGIPYQLCVVPSLNGPLISGSMSINDNNIGHPVLPPLNVGPITSQATPLTASNLEGQPINKVTTCDSVDLSENPSITRGLLTDLSESSRMPSDILASNTLEASNSYQLEFLDSSTFSFQEDYFIREETSKTVCDLNYSETAFIPQTNSLSYSGCELLEDSKQTEGYSFLHDGQQNNVSDPAKSSVVSVLCDTLTNAGACTSNVGIVQAEPSCLAASMAANSEGAVQVEPRGKSEDSKDVGSGPNPSKITFSPSEHNVTLGSNASVAEPQNTSNTILKKLPQVCLCPECGKQFSSASTFKRHLKVHFGDKPHKCLYCGKCFCYKFNLTVHLRSHTGVRPFECPACGKKFRYQSELKEHKQSHDGSKVFKCPDCGQHFARQRDLRRHSLSHQKSGKPTCHICHKTFSRVDYMKRHIKSHKSSDQMDLENLQDLNRSLSENAIKCKISKKSPCLEKVSNTHKIDDKALPGNSKKKPKSRRGETKSSRKRSVATAVAQPDYNTNTAASAEGSQTSDNLISLAFQAAEDGVEFTFVQDIADGSEVERGSSWEVADDSVIYVQILDSAK